MVCLFYVLPEPNLIIEYTKARIIAEGNRGIIIAIAYKIQQSYTSGFRPHILTHVMMLPSRKSQKWGILELHTHSIWSKINHKGRTKCFLHPHQHYQQRNFAGLLIISTDNYCMSSNMKSPFDMHIENLASTPFRQRTSSTSYNLMNKKESPRSRRIW